MNRKLRHSLVLLALAFSVGCEDEIQMPKNSSPPAEEQAGEPAQPQAGTPVATVDDSDYVRPEYPESLRRNPFQPDPEVVQPKSTFTEGEVRTREPLERFGLGELGLVAIISEVAVPKAMFVDPEGFGHVVKEGDRVGRNGGIISDIRDNAVEVTEGGDDEESQTLQRVIKLREVELTSERDGLTPEEREALERLLKTEEGREALQRQFESNAPGANASGTQQTPPPQGGQAPPGRVDPRFRGLAPPASN